MKNYKQFTNEEIHIIKKYNEQKPGQHNILYLSGSRSEFIECVSKLTCKLNVTRRKQGTYNLLSQFGDNVEYPIIYWRGGDMLFDEIDEIIDEKNIDVIVGNSAGGYLSFYLSNYYKIPALSLVPAIAISSEAPTLQSIPNHVKNAPIYGKQLIAVGELDTKKGGGVDSHLVIEYLNEVNFEEKGGEIITLPDTGHSLSKRQFDMVFKHFHNKYVK